MASISSVAKSAQNASEIGWAFVPQYYTFVNKDPSRLHCFYTKRSTLIHSTEGEEATPCFGQQEIHNKFMSLNFDDCKVFVSNVDSQSSADGGIIVQVLGEMSNGAGPWRKFAQTFFLAEQPNGFFVLNDIFRYIKEEVDDDEPEAEPVTVTEDVPSSEHSLIISNTDALPPSYQAESSSNTLPVASTETKPVASSSPAQSIPSFPASSAVPTPSVEPVPGNQTLGPSKVNGFHQDQVDSKPPEATIESTKSIVPSESSPPTAPAPPSASPAPAAGPSSTSANTNNVNKPDVATTTTLSTPPQPSTSSQAPSANGRSLSGQSKPAPIPVSAATQTKPVEVTPQAAPTPSAPKTWASLAASGKSAWGQGHLAASQGVSTAPSALSQSGVDSSSQASHQRPNANSHPNLVDSISTGACFIKNVHESLDEKSMKEQLVKRFGPIKDLDLIRTKACGFLEFQSIESAKKAIQICLPVHLGGKGGISISSSNGEEFSIVIESKRQPGERGRPMDAGPKRGFGTATGGNGNAGNGAGHERGGRSGGGNGNGNFGANGGRGGRGGMEGSRGNGRGGRGSGGGGGGGGGGHHHHNPRGISHPK
ncbi:hypothetical protein DFH28DRAFT_1078288 [Melampsora americana]|nr:hypothetical protein DFH28DRAFT_1078288 [Melampsora americana]